MAGMPLRYFSSAATGGIAHDQETEAPGPSGSKIMDTFQPVVVVDTAIPQMDAGEVGLDGGLYSS